MVEKQGLDVFDLDSPKGVDIPEGDSQHPVREYDKTEPSSLMSVEKAQLDVAISTARAYPRSVNAALQRARSLACAREDIAQGMTYALKRGQKIIKGPSIRLAEVMATSWGNARYGAHIVEEGRSYVVARGYAHDLETNVYAEVETRRRITHSDGRRYNDDMITVTSNAACAVAMRNALFKVIPGGFVTLIQTEAQRVARRESEGLEARRDKALSYFEKLGVTREQVLWTLGARGVEDIDWEGIDTMLGFATSIQSGEASVEGIFYNGEAEAAQGGTAPPEGRTSTSRGSAAEGSQRAAQSAPEQGADQHASPEGEAAREPNEGDSDDLL